VSPALHHSDEVTVDLAPGQEHPQHLVPEDRLQILQVEFRGEPETSPAVEAAVGAEYMAMRVEALGKVPERLDGDDGAWGVRRIQERPP